MPWASDQPYPWPDPYSKTLVIGHCGDFRVDVMPMIFNDRVVVLHKDSYETSVIAGFCYDKGAPALAAAIVWVANWDEMDVPVGFKKEAFNALHLYGKGPRR